MKLKPIYLLMVLMLIPSAVAAENQTNTTNTTKEVYTGIVLNASGYVQYKYYMLDTLPTLQIGEYNLSYTDINSVMKGAKYDGETFVNPVYPVYPMTEYEEKLVVVSETGLDPITQAAISAATGAGAAYLVVRRRKTG